MRMLWSAIGALLLSGSLYSADVFEVTFEREGQGINVLITPAQEGTFLICANPFPIAVTALDDKGDPLAGSVVGMMEPTWYWDARIVRAVKREEDLHTEPTLIRLPDAELYRRIEKETINGADSIVLTFYYITLEDLNESKDKTFIKPREMKVAAKLPVPIKPDRKPSKEDLLSPF